MSVDAPLCCLYRELALTCTEITHNMAICQTIIPLPRLQNLSGSAVGVVYKASVVIISQATSDVVGLIS
jgi:hypothetical protein